MTKVLKLSNILKSFKGAVLNGVDLELYEGEFLTLFGKPSSGKSTILRIVMGLEEIDGGTVFLRGADVAGLVPAKRMIGYVPQSFALFPDKSAYENIAYPLTFTWAGADKTKELVGSMAEMLHIGHLLEKRPSQLSGGEKQRVAIARGLVKKCDLYILDDPLAGLDFKLREKLIDDLRDLKQSMNATLLYATSDPLEALSLSDRIAVLDSGRILDSGAPRDVYSSPTHLSTMASLGFPEANVLDARIEAREPLDLSVDARILRMGVAVEGSGYAAGEDAVIAVRPESIRMTSSDARAPSAGLGLEGRIVLIEDLGSEMIVHVDVGDYNFRVMMRHDEGIPAMGEAVHLEIPYDRILVFAGKDRGFIGRGKGAING
jgi:ABC-type sugar transport system ATPase subunit